MEESSLSEIEIEINSDLKSYKDNEEYIVLREVIVSKKCLYHLILLNLSFLSKK